MMKKEKLYKVLVGDYADACNADWGEITEDQIDKIEELIYENAVELEQKEGAYYCAIDENGEEIRCGWVRGLGLPVYLDVFGSSKPVYWRTIEDPDDADIEELIEEDAEAVAAILGVESDEDGEIDVWYKVYGDYDRVIKEGDHAIRERHDSRHDHHTIRMNQACNFIKKEEE